MMIRLSFSMLFLSVVLSPMVAVWADQPPKADSPTVAPTENSTHFTIDKKYLIVPIKNGAPPVDLTLEVEGKAVRRYKTELATSKDDIDWYAFFTIESYKGKSATLTAIRSTEKRFALIKQANKVPGSSTWYTEVLRPQLHFSQVVGWNNDPNGMVYSAGEWHLYFQHNPVGWKWGNMTWGHAISNDLVHWKQLPNVLFHKTTTQGACYSGSAVVDHRNTGSFKTGKEDVIVAFLTDTGADAGESLVFSNDRGRTFTWYKGNPVVKHRGRDPKVIWYKYDDQDSPLNEEASKLGGHWVMAVYDEQKQYGKNIAFYTSTDLKQWKEQSHLSGYYECPELFELPVNDNKNDTRWVAFAADAQYAVGQFDGRKFTPEHKGKQRLYYGSYYASQTFNNSPDGRKIQVGWARISMPGMPFNQTFSLPTELTLKSTCPLKKVRAGEVELDEEDSRPNRPTSDNANINENRSSGVRLCAVPIRELTALRGKVQMVGSQLLSTEKPIRIETDGQLFDIVVEVQPRNAQEIKLQFGGNRVTYNVATAMLDEMPLPLSNGTLKFRVIVDRPMFEIVGGEGNVYKTARRSDAGKAIDSIQLSATGGEAKIKTWKVYPMQSIWKK